MYDFVFFQKSNGFCHFSFMNVVMKISTVSRRIRTWFLYYFFHTLIGRVFVTVFRSWFRKRTTHSTKPSLTFTNVSDWREMCLKMICIWKKQNMVKFIDLSKSGKHLSMYHFHHLVSSPSMKSTPCTFSHTRPRINRNWNFFRWSFCTNPCFCLCEFRE